MSEDKHKTNSSGMEIAAPRLMEQKASVAENAVFSLTVVLLGILGAAWCFISAFSLPVLPLTVNLYALLFTAIFTLSYFFKRSRIYIHFLFVVLYTIAAWHFRSEMAQGFVITTNQIMKTYASHSGLNLPVYLVTVKRELYPEICTLFLVFILFIVTGLVCCAVIKQKSLRLTFFVTAPFLLAALAFTITPNFIAVLSLFACWAVLLLTRLPAEKKRGFLKIRSGYAGKSSSAAARSGLISIPALFLCFALILSLFPRESYQRPRELDKIRSNLVETAANSPLLNGSRALAGNTDHVDLNNAGSIHFTGETALQIKSDKQYPLYLKSFAGSVFTGSGWEKLPDSDYTGINRQLGNRNAQNMLYLFASLLHQQNNPTLNPFGVRIKNVNASKQCIYAPYNLSTTPEAITGVHFVNDEFIRSDSLFGTSEYTFYAYGFGQGQISSNISGLVYSVMTKRLYHSDEDVTIPNSAESFFHSQEKYNALNSENVKSYYETTIPENVLQAMDIKSRDYMEAEQDYRVFLYDKYTQLPQSTREKVQKLLKQEGLMDSVNIWAASQAKYYSGVESMVNAVKHYLSKNCSYTLNPGKVPAGEDFTEYFLTKSHQGYCVHFATAATVMLRAMGVPVRYAEGYIVTPDDYKNASAGGWANIPDCRAHAWVEIYYPGLGWQPLEVTPGFNVEKNLTQESNPVNPLPAQNSLENESSSQGAAESSPEKKTESEAPSSAAPSSAANPAAETGAKAATADSKAAQLPILIAAAVLFSLLVFTVLKRKYVLSQREKCFTQPNFSKAAVGVYAYLTRLTKFGGEISAEFNELAQKARFSRNGITKDELKVMTDSARRLAQENYGSLPKWKQILFKYIHNLL